MKIKITKAKYKVCMNYFDEKISYALFIRNDRPDENTIKTKIFPFLKKWKFIKAFKTVEEVKSFVENKEVIKNERI